MTYDPQLASLLPAQNEDAPRAWTPEWFLEWFVGAPLRVLGLVVAGIFVRWLVHRLVDRIVIHATPDKVPSRVFGSRRAAKALKQSAIYSERRALRAQTLGELLKSIATFTIATLVILMALAEYYQIGPLLASAGIAGVALGFGAQNLVKDFISGVFMLLEDQYGVGDVIDMGEASGTVEDVGLRVTRLRDVNGTVWHVRNGEVVRIGNMSQGWARAVLDVRVGYDEDIETVTGVLADTAAALAVDPEFSELILEEPEVWGVEQLEVDSIVMRVVLKTRPLEQWKVAREMRERIKAAFDERGIKIPYPHRSVVVREAGGLGRGSRSGSNPDQSGSE